MNKHKLASQNVKKESSKIGSLFRYKSAAFTSDPYRTRSDQENGYKLNNQGTIGEIGESGWGQSASPKDENGKDIENTKVNNPMLGNIDYNQPLGDYNGEIQELQNTTGSMIPDNSPLNVGRKTTETNESLAELFNRIKKERVNR